MLLCWASINKQEFGSQQHPTNQEDKKQTVFKSYKQIKNLKHTQLIVTIAVVTEKCTNHPKLSL